MNIWYKLLILFIEYCISVFMMIVAEKTIYTILLFTILHAVSIMLLYSFNAIEDIKQLEKDIVRNTLDDINTFYGLQEYKDFWKIVVICESFVWVLCLIVFCYSF